MRLVDGVWIKPDVPRPRRIEAGKPSSLIPFASSNEILELLRSFHNKQDYYINLIQVLESKFDNIRVKINSEFLEIHQRLNTITSQLN